jgi:hypothetical protein
MWTKNYVSLELAKDQVVADSWTEDRGCGPLGLSNVLLLAVLKAGGTYVFW